MMNGLLREYEENYYILVQLSKCIQISNNDKLLKKLHELKKYLIEEQAKINDFIENRD